MATLKEIAQEVGVQESTVSRILNKKSNTIKFSAKTIERVKKAAIELGYQPNAAARALATKRSGYIGFILSDQVQEGWGNMFYNRYLSGVEKACQQFGYGLNICRYNLSNLENFIFPKGVGQRSVDGVIICGDSDPEVVKKFISAGIQVVSLGYNSGCFDQIPALAVDAIDGFFQAAVYAAEQGHRRMLFCINDIASARATAAEFIERCSNSEATSQLSIDIYEPPSGYVDYAAATPLFEYWSNLPAQKKPTVILGSDQIIVGMARQLKSNGFSCPEDISLISGDETQICSMAFPAITSIYHDTEELACRAVEKLVDYLDRNISLAQHAMIQHDLKAELIIRASTGQAKVQS